MKMNNFAKIQMAAAAVIFLGGNLLAQNSPAGAAPPLAYGVPQIVQLAQAKISDDTIIAYIRNSGNSYGLDANQIIYLRQQGISDNVLNAMLSQPKAAPATAQPAAQPDNSSVAQASTAYSQPATTYVQTVPSSTVYVMPDTQTYYYNAYYARPYYYSYYPYYVNPFPVVGLSFGFGGGFHGGFRGGFHGWHR